MTVTQNWFIPALVLFAPTLLWLIGLVPNRVAVARPRLMRRITETGAWLAFVGALLAAGAHLFDRHAGWMLWSTELPWGIGALSLSTYINAVTVIMLLLVSFVGAIVTRYARTYLDGDPNQGRFHKWLTLTLASILTLIVSGNLLMFSIAWIATSLCLHRLLTFYKDRPAAMLAAHKKFIASRIGDASLLAAIFLIGSTLNTIEFSEIFARMAALEGPLPAPLQAASLLIVVSAALKSAQFPLHGWLIQVMEAPTPVSALLHAGIVNAGAFLVIRMSPIMSHAEIALGVLAAIGLVTLALASLVMLTQTSIKVSLAWSTTAQMGFMLLECGLGLYSLAMLHLVAHSLYKAHAFLASGSGVDAFRAPTIALPAAEFKPGRFVLALATGSAVALVVGAAFGIAVGDQPALLAAGAIVAIAISQLLLQAAGTASGASLVLRGVVAAVAVSVAYFSFHVAFEMLLDGSVMPVSEPGGPVETVLAIAVVAVFSALFALQQALKHAPTALGEGLYVHLYNGLYIDVYITRILQRVWPGPQPRPVAPRAPFAPVPPHGGQA